LIDLDIKRMFVYESWYYNFKIWSKTYLQYNKEYESKSIKEAHDQERELKIITWAWYEEYAY
jgi:hypothetical protein